MWNVGNLSTVPSRCRLGSMVRRSWSAEDPNSCSQSPKPLYEQGKQEEMKAKQQAEMKRKAEEHQRTPLASSPSALGGSCL